MKKTLLILLLIPTAVFSQIYPNKEAGKKNTELIDSLKKTEYPYSLPIWGKKAYKAGISLPLPEGVSVQYVGQKSEVVIDNLSVGFNNGEQTKVEDAVRLENTVTTLNGVNVRPDVWLFPFLNVYAILAYSEPATTTDVGIYLPDSTGSSRKVVDFEVESRNPATSLGFGLTPTMGIKGFWLAIDLNFTWTDIPTLNKPAFAFVLGPRFGKTFRFKRKDSNLSIWAGGFRLSLNTGTDGNFPLKDAVNTENLQAKVDQGLAALDESYAEINTWWNNLSPAEQNKPVNKAKYEEANKKMDAAGQLLNGLDQGVSTIEQTNIHYTMDKRPKDKWNFIVGAQYQINKHFMLRGEFGFLGTRTQFIGGIQYRFGI